MTELEAAWVFFMSLVGLNVGIWGTLFYLKWRDK